MIASILIILILVFIAILAVINVYLLKLYCHKDDKGWNKALYSKILIVLGLTLCQAQAFMVSLDVANSVDPLNTNGINMLLLWVIVYAVVLLMVSILLPYAIFFYQTDQQKSLCRRIITAFCYNLGAIIVSALLLFITWTFFKYVQLPYTQLTLNQDQSFNRINQISKDSIKESQTQKVMEFQTSLAVYIMAILSFFGWIFVVIFGGVGLFALPIDLINQFRHRPRPRRSQQMFKAKQAMTIALRDLVKQSDQITALNVTSQRNAQAGFMSKMRINRQLQNKLNTFKIKYYNMEEQYQIFNLQLKFADTNPFVPFCKLLLGMIFLITAILWKIQIIFGNLAKAYNKQRPFIPFMNELLTGLEDRNAGFLSMFIFAYLFLYMIWSVQKGSIKFGIRLSSCCKFHPMIPNETWLNSFLFNVIILLIGSVGVMQLCMSCFPIYTRNTDIFIIFGNTFRYITFYKYFYDKNVFTIALVVWTFIALIYMLVTINKKPSYLKEIENIREKKLQAKRQAN